MNIDTQIKAFALFMEVMKDTDPLLIESCQEGFDLCFNVNSKSLIEGFEFPAIPNLGRKAMDNSRERKDATKVSGKQLSDEEIATNKAKFDRENKKAKQNDWRVSGSMASVTKFALTDPSSVEKWMENTLKPAIKQGKQEIDNRYGTNEAKRGFFDRVKGAAKSFTESEEA